MNIIILGGHGFAGKNVEEVLINSNYSTYSISRKDGLELTDYNSIKKYFIKLNPDVIINCAADVGSLNYVTHYAARVFDTNMRMLLNIFRAASEILPNSVLINPIANCAFPGNVDFYTEDNLWEGKIHQSVLSYGSTRRMIGVLSECYKMQNHYRSINYFVPNMYGPFDSTDPNKAHALNALISKVVKAKKENSNEIEVWGSGIVIREWLYVKDFARVVNATLNDLDNSLFTVPFNIGQNFGLSISDLVNIIVEECNFNGKISWNTKMQDGALKKVMDNKKFRNIFPDFEFTDFKIGIHETIHYYESIYPY